MKILIAIAIIYWVIGLIVAIGYVKVCKIIDKLEIEFKEFEEREYPIKNNADFLILLLLWPCLIIGIAIGIKKEIEKFKNKK